VLIIVGDRGDTRFQEFLTADILNPNTHRT